MSISWARASRIASSCPKDFDFQYFIYQSEGEYAMWTDMGHLLDAFYFLPDQIVWNMIMCWTSIICVIFHTMEYESSATLYGLPVTTCLDIFYNVFFALYILSYMFQDLYKVFHEKLPVKKADLLFYFIDILSFCHYPAYYVFDYAIYHTVKVACYYWRWHQPIHYLWNLMEYSLKGTVIITLFKYIHLTVMVRVFATTLFIYILSSPRWDTRPFVDPPEILVKNCGIAYARHYFDVVKLMIPIKPDKVTRDDYSKINVMIMNLAGALLIMIPVASLALIIGLYMSPEERFRSRFRIIMNEMKLTRVPHVMRRKVETFYRMYWHKQKAVSKTELLGTFPPALITAAYMDIYFEAVQKSQILRDLSYQFLSEIAKFMTTINYVPGDTILKRNSPKSTIVYIAYGDVEMLTAEDDLTPILRFTRGSIMNPCGGCVEVGSSKAHVAIRAATFCTAHVLKTSDLWHIAEQYGKYNGQSFILHSSFEEHLEKVKRHYGYRAHPPVKHTSSIAYLKRNLIDLKEARDKNGKLLLRRSDMFLQIAGCYLMRNQKDSTFAEESDDICLRTSFPCIVQPSSSLLIAWHCFVAMLTMAVVIIHPLQMVFYKTQSTKFKFFNHMATLVFTVDIITHLSTGAKLEAGVPITFTQTSSEQMKSYWFVLDVLAIVPVFEFIGDGHYSGLTKLIKLSKVFRVLKSLETVFMYHTSILRFTSYCLLLFTMNYLLGVLQQLFSCYELKSCVVNDIGKKGYWEPSSELDDESVGLRFMASYYWSLCMLTLTDHKTSASGTKSWPTLIYWIFTLELCVLMYVMIRATYSAAVMANALTRYSYKTCINSVKCFLIKNNVDPVLRHRFTTYLELCWYTDKAYSITHEKASVTFDLPVHVNQELLNMQRSKYILCLPFIKFLNYAALKEISSRAHLFYTSPNEILLHTGDVSNEIYVIKQGFCEVIDPITKRVVALKTSRGHFGDLECLLRIPAYYTVRAVTHVQLFSVSRKYLLKIIALPNIKNAIRFARTQPEYEVLQQSRKEFLEYTIPPRAANREWFPLPRKHEPDTDFLHPFKRLGFFSILRYVFPRFTICPDGSYLQRYEYFRSVCALLSAYIFPVYQILVLQWPNLYYFMWIMDISAYYDILQRMLVGYYNDEGILVYHPASTAAHYLKGAFLLDLSACLPLEGLDTMRNRYDPVKRGTRYTGTSQMLMFNRLMQLYRVPHAIAHSIKKHIERPDIGFIIQTVPFFLALISTMTSTILEASIYKYHIKESKWFLEIRVKNVSKSWIHMYQRQVKYNIMENPWHVVLTTYFWATSELTCLGFKYFMDSAEDIMTYLIVWKTAGTVFITYIAVRIISTRCNVNNALATFQDHLKDLVSFMKKEKIDKKLSREVLQYYEYVWEKTGGTDYRTVLKLCDQITLRTDAILHIYGKTFAKCPILYDCDISLLRVLGRAVFSIYYRRGMVIVERDDVISDLYFIDNGTMDMRYQDDDEHVLTKLPRGSVFGNLDDAKYQVCPNRFIACSNMHLLRINSKMFHAIIQDFPVVRILLNKYRPSNQNYIIGGVKARGKVKTVWKERAKSSPLIIVTRAGFMKALHTHSDAVQVFLILISLGCVFGDIYNAGFHDNNFILIGVLYILDMAFFMKIILNYVLPFITDEESESRVALVSSRKKYYKGEFKYDVLSCLPFEVLCLISHKPWSIFAYLRLNRIFRMVTVNTSLNRYYEKLNINMTISSICEMVVWFSLYVHICTCMWAHIGLIEESIWPGTSWRWHVTGKDLCPGSLYISSLYFIVTVITLTGVGDILPTTSIEVVFVCILMIVSAYMYMLYVGDISHIIHYRAFRCFDFYSKYLELQEFLACNRVSDNLVKLSQAYSLYLWREARGMQTPKFLVDAPQVLKENVMSAVYMVHIHAHPVFSQCEPAFQRQLVACLKPYYYSEDMYVVKEGDMSGAMFFIHKGQVQELDEDMEETLKLYTIGENFGSFQGLHPDSSYSLSYKTIVRSQVLTLYYKNWEYLLEHFPNSKNIIFPSKAPPPPAFVIRKSLDDDKSAQDKRKVQITQAPEVQEFIIERRKEDDDEAEADDTYEAPWVNLVKYLSSGKESSTLSPQQLNASATEPIPPEETGQYTDVKIHQLPADTDTVVPADAKPSIEFIIPQSIVQLGQKETKMRNEEDPTTETQVQSSASVPQEPVVDISQWPMDSRRRSTIMDPKISTEYTTDHDESNIAEQSQPEHQHEKPESDIHGIDKIEIKDVKFVPSQSDTFTFEPPMTKDYKEESSPLPLESKRHSAESEIENIPKPAYGRRKSMVHGVDRAAVDRELASLKSTQDFQPLTDLSGDTASSPLPLEIRRHSSNSEVEDVPKPAYGRRKSMVQGVDRAAVDRELASLKSIQDFQPLTGPSLDASGSFEEANILPLKSVSEEEIALKKITYMEFLDEKGPEEELSETKLERKHSLLPLYESHADEGLLLTAKSEIIRPDLLYKEKVSLSDEEETKESLQTLINLQDEMTSTTKTPEKPLASKISDEVEKKESLQTLIELQEEPISLAKAPDEPLTLKISDEVEKKESLQTLIELQEKTVSSSKVPDQPSILKMINESIVSVHSNESLEETEEESVHVIDKELLRRKSFAQKVRGFIGTGSKTEHSSEGVDTLLIEQDKAAIASLLKQLNKEERIRDQSSTSTEKRPRAGLTFDEPEKPDVTDINIDALELKERRSMLSFKEEITTFEVPNKDDRISVVPEPILNTEELHAQSMKSFLDDIALHTKSLSSITTDNEQLSDEDEDTNKKESVSSIKSKASRAQSIWGVEEFMMKKGKEGDKIVRKGVVKKTESSEDTKPSPSYSSQKQGRVQVLVDSPSQSSEDSSESDTVSSTKAKAARAQSIWGVEDFMMKKEMKGANKTSQEKDKAQLKINSPSHSSDEEERDKSK